MWYNPPIPEFLQENRRTIMPGKLCTGATTNSTGTLKSSKAFCEGMAYRASGTAIAKPKVDNPHVAGSDAATAWDLGWDFAEAGKSASVPLDTSATCCAAVGLVAL